MMKNKTLKDYPSVKFVMILSLAISIFLHTFFQVSRYRFMLAPSQGLECLTLPSKYKQSLVKNSGNYALDPFKESRVLWFSVSKFPP